MWRAPAQGRLHQDMLSSLKVHLTVGLLHDGMPSSASENRRLQHGYQVTETCRADEEPKLAASAVFSSLGPNARLGPRAVENSATRAPRSSYGPSAVGQARSCRPDTTRQPGRSRAGDRRRGRSVRCNPVAAWLWPRFLYRDGPCTDRPIWRQRGRTIARLLLGRARAERKGYPLSREAGPGERP